MTLTFFSLGNGARRNKFAFENTVIAARVLFLYSERGSRLYNDTSVSHRPRLPLCALSLPPPTTAFAHTITFVYRTLSAHQKKTDMNEEMATDTQECAVTAIEKHSGNYENASKMLQEEMCKKYVQCKTLPLPYFFS